MPSGLTDYTYNPGRIVPPEDVWSCSEPDQEGLVTAVVALGGMVVRIRGRRVFEMAGVN